MAWSRAGRFPTQSCWDGPGPGYYEAKKLSPGPCWSFGQHRHRSQHRQRCECSGGLSNAVAAEFVQPRLLGSARCWRLAPKDQAKLAEPHLKHIMLSDVKLGEMIGQGGLSTVLQVQYADKSFAFKRVKPHADCMPPDQLESDRRAIRAEAFLLHKLLGGISVQVFALVEERANGCEKVAGFLMELLGPTLHESSQNGELSAGGLLESAKSAACGLAFLHFKLIAHRDIKPSNMARKSMQVWSIKYIDFDCSLELHEMGQKVTSKPGTLEYWSPGAWCGDYDPIANDIFALAKSLMELTESLLSSGTYSGCQQSIVVAYNLAQCLQPFMESPGESGGARQLARAIDQVSNKE